MILAFICGAIFGAVAVVALMIVMEDEAKKRRKI